MSELAKDMKISKGNSSSLENNASYKQRRKFFEMKQSQLLHYSSATLGSGNLREAVKLPKSEDPNEWIAVNILDFFNQISMLFGTISEHCTAESCPKMCAGSKYEYSWTDGRKTIACPAPTYIDYLLTWVHDQLDDESVFSTQIGVPFPPNFMQIAQTIMKRLFRIYGHIYYQHIETIEHLNAIEHLNTSFKHFMLFVHEFKLIESKDLAPLQEIVDRLAPAREIKI
ncbi:unnamed protein product [Dracunculus medinensis]|uniref:MOB kinase activator-like 1 n=1 Tax=Dracunculus medinensis TaxID=318479 RepID=A0A0N4U9S9_DRAME|nr:unnamed protein product [Dracunculus medinensis]